MPRISTLSSGRTLTRRTIRSELDHEDAQAGVAEHGQGGADPLVDRVVRAQPEHERVEDDDAEDERLEAARVGDPPASLCEGPRHGSQPRYEPGPCLRVAG
jgi:hypothetical protein